MLFWTSERNETGHIIHYCDEFLITIAKLDPNCKTHMRKRVFNFSLLISILISLFYYAEYYKDRNHYLRL